MEFEGFHGTDEKNYDSILCNNFSVSAKDDEWLGTGAYFFIDGISEPLVDARNWAKVQSYDSDTGGKKYHRYAVIKATIKVDLVLRLDEREGQIAYNVFRNYLIEKMKKERIRPKVGAIRNDCEVCNHILENTEFEAIINHEYIKLDVWSRRKRYASRIPTCRIISVKEPKTAIDVNGLKVVEKGRI
ncbi:TPA: hypothetical protein MYV55_000374 [Klebsiella aerogenes]|uniref:hypothetical protein n=1 Tax=Klebsiella aerogenes TaxID=548 RepID=UPI003890F6F5|nr:hypothetical protein [Klebsiella aerogenes]HCM1705856.1 hypothetical protein [Klebsiella aerogenes]